MHISLTETLEDYVKTKVKSGLYNNASEVVREALRLKIAADASDAAKLQRLREAIDVGWQQADRGEFADYSLKSVLSELDAETAENA